MDIEKKTTSAQVTQNLQFLNRITDCICHCLLKSYCQRQSPAVGSFYNRESENLDGLVFWQIQRSPPVCQHRVIISKK